MFVIFQGSYSIVLQAAQAPRVLRDSEIAADYDAPRRTTLGLRRAEVPAAR
jgi:hypothetical protein